MDDEFDDDDLDGIPDSTLHRLEQRASIFSTQQAREDIASSRRALTYHYGSANAYNVPGSKTKGQWTAPRPERQMLPPMMKDDRSRAIAVPQPPSSDYGFDDEDVIDLDEPSMVIEPSAGALPTRSRADPQLRMNPTSRRDMAPLDQEVEAAYAAADAELKVNDDAQRASAPHLQPQHGGALDVGALQARVAQLESEAHRLKFAEQEARNMALAKQGEIAIVRSNQEKTAKEYERRIAMMQQGHAEESARQKAELEKGRKEREKMETNNRFLQHNLAQEAERTKRLTGPGKARVGAFGSRAETPRKKDIATGDGFDDDEVRMGSPSKTRNGSRDPTPRAGNKRKRNVEDGPLPALALTEPKMQSRTEERTMPTESGAATRTRVPTTFVSQDDKFEFMRRLLGHIPYEGHERSIEALSKHFLPSQPTRSLSAHLVDCLSAQGTIGSHLPLQLSHIVLDIWSRCLDEKFYPPLYLLLDLSRFALSHQPASIWTHIIDDAVPLCIRSIELIANAMARASLHPSFAASAECKAQLALTEHVDVDETLDFLHTLCDAASLSSESTAVFWRKTDISFTLLMLNKAHPISHITVALQMLHTSALDTAFGPITVGPELDTQGSQRKQEDVLVERLTGLLFDLPNPLPDEPPYSETEIAELRLEVLNLLKDICSTPYGGLLLTSHRMVTGRLVKFLDGQIRKLYTLPPDMGTGFVDGTRTAHVCIVQTINVTVRLIYHLHRIYGSHMSFMEKLAAVKGGYHKFLVSMTRIAFAETTGDEDVSAVFEAGIAEDVIEAAHDILDDVLSPQEGEAICQAIATPKASRTVVLSGGPQAGKLGMDDDMT